MNIWGDGQAIGDMIRAVMQGEQILTILIVDVPRSYRCSAADRDCVLEGATFALEKSSAPLAIAITLLEN